MLAHPCIAGALYCQCLQCSALLCVVAATHACCVEGCAEGCAEAHSSLLSRFKRVAKERKKNTALLLTVHKQNPKKLENSKNQRTLKITRNPEHNIGRRTTRSNLPASVFEILAIIIFKILAIILFEMLAIRIYEMLAVIFFSQCWLLSFPKC